uniref:Uncharacterized protein n=1 Tax=Solanum lycopersicum TaxID=4081 RepID=K4AX46_SOLLC
MAPRGPRGGGRASGNSASGSEGSGRASGNDALRSGWGVGGGGRALGTGPRGLGGSGGSADENLYSKTLMEDEHIRIDDLSAHLGSLVMFPKPSAFYGATASYLHILFALCIFKGRACLTFSFIGFDGHGGPEAADTNFPKTSEVDDAFLGCAESFLRKGFLLADLALAEDCNVCSSSGITAKLTALMLGSKIVIHCDAPINK